GKQYRKVFRLFIIGLFCAILIAISFTYKYTLFIDNVIYLLLILSLLIPIYYSEFILGFILGMTYTFGAILPTVFILIFAAIGFIIYRFIRPVILKLPKITGKILSKNRNR
ncbi:hypothetical protein LB467_18785, partial [Salegentibacter sp. JZCK2]|uniref:hypothetical protein n=1 Tax=Salegentibacter tibetensis TaxID=2873600 RepID=UPI001CCB0DD5